MLPTDDDIRGVAYKIWEIKGGGHGHDQADWFEAKDDLTLALNYEAISAFELAGTPKAFVPIRHGSDRRCRYCGKGEPATSFRLEAHAIPEFLGNRSLLSYDECDQCNQYFGETIEDHCAKFTLPIRSCLAISGKKWRAHLPVDG